MAVLRAISARRKVMQVEPLKIVYTVIGLLEVCGNAFGVSDDEDYRAARIRSFGSPSFGCRPECCCGLLQ
ncbi:MAG: hypothetical protein INF12_11940 [Methylobacterium sp.]|nr:hypothetical protein [Methylobacterium sp.]